MASCKHLGNIMPSKCKSILNPQKWACETENCGTTESVWACLSCGHVSCGRFTNEHALQHYRTTKHPLALEINDFYVFCYECDDYVVNDTKRKDIDHLRRQLEAIAKQNFQPGGKILRSRREAAHEHQVAPRDLQTAVIKYRRLSLLSKVFAAWRSLAVKDKHPEKLFVRPTANSSINELPMGVTGLRNLGNTCYMNSVLQVLGNLDPFRLYFLNNSEAQPVDKYVSPIPKRISTAKLLRTKLPAIEDVREKQINGKNGLSGGAEHLVASTSKPVPNNNDSLSHDASLKNEMNALIHVMWSGKLSLCIPYGFLNAMWSAVPTFRGYRQQDAQEFLCEMLDKLESELQSTGGKLRNGRKRRRLSSDGESDMISALFQGELQSEVHCLRCGNRSETVEPFTDLSLEFPAKYHDNRFVTVNNTVEIRNISKRPYKPNASDCELQEMLEAFTAPEDLGAVYRCTKCCRDREKSPPKPGRISRRRSSESSPGRNRKNSTTLAPAEKQMRIRKLPPVVRLHLKRFRWSGRNNREKISVHVTFPEYLDLSAYCLDDDSGANANLDGDRTPNSVGGRISNSVGGRTANSGGDRISNLDGGRTPNLDGGRISNSVGRTNAMANSDGDRNYRLSAVIIHHGRGFNSGHYTAYVWHSDGNFWLHCNDAHMEMVSVEDVLQAQAYILFYTKVQNHQRQGADQLIRLQEIRLPAAPAGAFERPKRKRIV